MRLQTPRLILREYVPEDFPWLHEIFSDPETMQHYPYSFDEDRTRAWIQRNIHRYRDDGFGLWAVELKSTGRPIGDCGLTLQNIHGTMLPEIGYHIHKDYQKQGYATEAARACKRYAFEKYPFEAVYSYMKYTNLASQRVAVKNGMRFVEEYDDPANIITRVYAISRREWQEQSE